MTLTARRVAAGLKAVLPCSDDHRDATPEMLEAMRRAWGVCVGAVAEALQAEHQILHHQRIEFYRLCGVEIYD